MGFHHLAASGSMALFKRAVDSHRGDGQRAELPPWAFGFLFLNMLVFLPIILYTSYTLATVYPVLAIIESPEPPSYEPLPLNDEGESLTTTANGSGLGESPASITSSLRAIDRLLRSVGGWRANFRGLGCACILFLCVNIVGGMFLAVPFVPSFVGELLATLALVQLHTAWVHIVISPPSALPFWKRLPPFNRTFNATWAPIVALWLATSLAYWIPRLLAGLINLPLWGMVDPSRAPVYTRNDTWKALLVALTGLLWWALAVVPAKVIFVRVQASLLPPDEDAILTFDKSFGGAVEPAIVGGKGYVGFTDAFRTFPRESWIRLYILHAKIVAVTFMAYIIMFAVFIPEVMLMSNKVDGIDN